MSKFTDDDLRERMSRNARQLRRRKGLTQEQLAVAAGLTVQSISRVENGHALPRLPVAVRLAAGLDVSLDVLMNSEPGEEWTQLTPEEWDWVHLLRTWTPEMRAQAAMLLRGLRDPEAS